MRRLRSFMAHAMLLLAAGALLSQTPRSKDDYDPDKLSPGEVGCGRASSKKSPPCHCMRERMKKVNEAYEQCEIKYAGDKKKLKECMLAVPGCMDVKVTDVDQARQTDMPEQCKRSCTKARCECCTS